MNHPTADRPSKTRVRQAFERAAATYDAAAGIQRAVCHALLATLADAAPPAALLDAGAGTGYALPLLAERFPTAAPFALDLSPAMLARIAAPCCRLVGDLEHLPLAAASLDLYWSSLAVQWCELPRALAEARRVLRPGGRLAVASLGPETFAELRQAFAGIDDYQHTLIFHTPEAIARMALAAGFTDVAVDRQRQIAHYPDFRALLRAIKALGANQLSDGRRPHLMGRAAFAAAEAAAERQRGAAGLPLTYDVLILKAHR
ncbi:MAG: malonyl-ACP O-methyltransferase BioC [Betaproteobacteria bacterium]|nr:malonyl-ACP O-methyltransferase BioC [Betaproteobacteria bacterium]MCL2885891.1 malonyl-ACP O-methyltransferase BioC [Betaproteobacteria bacterium]